MSESFGNGVSRTLEAIARQFTTVVFQSGKPPLDSEINLAQQLQQEDIRQFIKSQIPSGFFTDPTRAREDFITAESWSNFFVLGNPQSGEVTPVVWANVNGWIVPVSGTQVSTDTDVRNIIRLFPPPATDARFDLIFLEVWQALVAPNESEVNKPAADKIWKHGNVEFGGFNLDDDIEDPAIGFETTERVQIQYRIRVFGSGAGLGASAALDIYPDGLDDPNVLGQATATSPVAGFGYTNMRETLGDPSLWRAGDGNPANGLGTVDGHSWAIPICALSRRNSTIFSAIQTAGNPNNNGALDRNPSAKFLTNPREGAKNLGTATLTNAISPTTTGDVEVGNLVGSGLDDPNINLANLFVVLDGEIIRVDAIVSTTTPGTITIPSTGRGRGGSNATRHEAGTALEFYSVRPDGLFADQITGSDIIDLRRSVNLGNWDYQRLLLHNLTALIQNNLQSSWKQSGTGDTQGVSVLEVDYLLGDGATANPNQTDVLDGPDGIRTVFSDSASLQTDVTVMLDNDAALSNGFTSDQFDSTVQWDVGADFKPSGWINNLGSPGSWTNGSLVFIYIGGDSGSEGARATFRDGNVRGVRFVGPREYWQSNRLDPTIGNQHPTTMRFLDQQAHVAAAPGEEISDVDAALKHPGPFYPLSFDLSSNSFKSFERPFIVLGGLLHASLEVTGINTQGAGAPQLVNGANGKEIDLGIDFDVLGGFYSLDTNGNFESDPTQVTTPLLRAQRTLFDMLTNFGRDKTGDSSDVYIALYGDTTSVVNNGIFKVVGAGTVGYTFEAATNATSIRVESMGVGAPATWNIAAGDPVTAQFRSQITNAEDGSGFAAGPASAALVIGITDIAGAGPGPWNSTILGPLAIPSAVTSKMVINLTLQYHPNRGGMSRVPDTINRTALVNAGSEYLRQAIATIDTTFPGETGLPNNETFYDQAPIQTWNRLPSLGLTESTVPKAPSFGGRVVLFNEQDREAELFVDKGSKTVFFRPYQDQNMTLEGVTTLANASLLGDINYPGAIPKDGAAIFTALATMGFPVPSEYMPRFGRHDIPFYVDITGNGTGRFLGGINHLFTDSTDPTEPVFSIIGGQDNTSGGNLVTPMYFQTGSTSGHAYAVYGTIVGPATPAYQARLTSDIGTLTTEAREISQSLADVISSDLGSGLVGIQLPPYLGVARVYGVYDRADFVSKGGATFESNRATLAADPATNLLKVDADRQTLFILQNGAKDLTLEDDDHTYIIPSNAIDITKSPFYDPGTKDQFEDFEFVVECAVFGFAKGWINKNNYTLTRLHDGTGALITDGDDPELEGVGMVLPSAATLNDALYALHTRTPYQGDPYMTRAGETRTVTDYEPRYGQVSIADSFELSKSIQQFDSNGDAIPEIPNARPIQVLAAIDFYTTLGTGKVGGTLFAGTMLDIGYTEDSARAASRIPESDSQPNWRTFTRVFTEGQRENTTRGQIVISGIPQANGAAVGVGVTITPSEGAAVTFIGVNGAPGAENEYTADTGFPAVATNLAQAIDNHSTIGNGQIVSAKLFNILDTTAAIILTSAFVGEEGNATTVELVPNSSGTKFTLETPRAGTEQLRSEITKANLAGGVDLVVNAGNGISPIPITGLTERLPLGILLLDSDFLGEDPLSNSASSLATKAASITAIQNALPLAESGEEFTRFLGDPGQLLSLQDGGILRYEAYNATTAPTGSKRFRLARGGGSAFVLTGKNPGGPVSWISASFPASVDPVLKGGVLACKALLVRNFKEEAFASADITTEGDEIQMVIMTFGILGDGNTRENGVVLDGIISPTGYGEGYAAADRYRLEGKPMDAGFSRTAPDPGSVTLAPFQASTEE